MEFLVRSDSVVRQIWGKADSILFIFAGAAAEFALNKSVDWLYFTGNLPSDPLGRLFSTVNYAKSIVFSEKDKAFAIIDKMGEIHKAIETKRGMKIPDWAYRDVLFMLIDYSIRAFELLERKMEDDEKAEVFNVFNLVGERMGIPGLPKNYHDWLTLRKGHMEQHLVKSDLTVNLFNQYKKHLGTTRFFLLKEAQILVIPDRVRRLLNFGKQSILRPFVPLYKLAAQFKLDKIAWEVLLPNEHKNKVKGLNQYQYAK